MTERYASHIFAHSEGRYQTVHAVGLAPHEVRLLEQFFFGQTADPKYLESLRAEPGLIWRRMGPRIALTRVLKGTPDANDRSTLRFETLVGDGAAPALRSRVSELCTAEWGFSADGVTVTAQPSRQNKPVHADRISEVVMAVRNGSRVVLPAEGLTLEDAARIIRHAADIPEFSLCYKSLNKQVPVSVNIVELAVSETVKVKSKRNPAPLPRGSSRPPSQRMAEKSSTSLMLGVILVALVIQTLVLWKVSSPPSGETDASNMHDDTINRIERGREDSATQSENLNEAISELEESLDEQGRQNEQRFADIDEAIEKQDTAFAIRGEEVREQIGALDTKKNAIKRSKQLVKSIGTQLTGLEDKMKRGFADIKSELKAQPTIAPKEKDSSEGGNILDWKKKQK